MRERDPLENPDLNRLKLFVYLVPVLGFFPALWTLYRRQGNQAERRVSRLSVTLALVWLLGYGLLSSGGQFSELNWSFRFLFLNTLFTSGYFLVSFGLMVRLWQRQSPRLPWISDVAEGAVRKHLS
jgi:hypothetical protein